MKRIEFIFLFSALFLLSGYLSYAAFLGPLQPGGQGSGAIGIDVSYNLSVGTSSTRSDTKFFILASSTSASDYSLRIHQPTGATIFSVRNDGRVGINTSSPAYALSVEGDLQVTGTIYNGNPLSASISAANVTPGVFNSATGSPPFSGNYSFPGSLAVNTSTNVGIPAEFAVYGRAAIGESSIATGAHSFAAGRWAESLADYAVSIGNAASAIGLNSVSIGLNSMATTTRSLAVGAQAIAAGVDASALGNGSYAATTSATAVGYNARAIGVGSVALSQNTSSGQYAFAAGLGNVAGGNYSSGLGYSNSIGSSATYGVALGYSNTVSSPYSVAIGRQNTVGNDINSMAFGSSNLSQGSTTIAIGSAHIISAGADAAIALGRGMNISATANNSIGISLSNSGGSLSQANTMAIVGGSVAIATTSAQYPLDINGALQLNPSSAPTGANGVIYYDRVTDEFRCYQDGAWLDCITQAALSGGVNDWVAKWTGTSTLATSSIRDDGTEVSFNLVNTTSAEVKILNGSLLASGTIGVTPAAGPGTRMMWIPSRAAFRSGQVTGTQWNDAAVGAHSFAVGYNTIADNTYAFAAGVASEAHGSASVAMGNANIIANTAPHGVALGLNNSVGTGAGQGVAIGNGNSVGNNNAVAIGMSNTANGGTSLALGYGNIVAGTNGVALGSTMTVNGNYSIGIGLSSSPATITSNNVMAIMGGNVGVRVVDPVQPLEILTTGTGSSIGAMRVRNTSSTASVDLYVARGDATSRTGTAVCQLSAPTAVCLAQWTSAGAASTCGASTTNQRVLCSDFGN